MGRLIDFDVCEKMLTEFYESSLNDHDAMLFVEFMAQLESVPTAYDVEKVVEQIHDYFCKVIDNCEEDKVPHEILKYNKSICEIVRKGGGGVDA